MSDLQVLGVSLVLGAGAAALAGPIYVASGGRIRTVLGWANALAAGLMLGAAFAVAYEGWNTGPSLGFGLGAFLGVVPGILTFRIQERRDLWDGDPGNGPGDATVSPTDTYEPLLRHALHASPEGVAIGVAAAMNLGLGLFLVAALAVHNVAEGLSLVRATNNAGQSVMVGSVRAAASNLPQVVMAIAAYLAALAWPQGIQVGVGFSVAALVYLCLVDLLPQSYERVGEETIAVVTALAMSVVPLLAGLLGL